MILESTIYEKLYSDHFPDLTLSAIYEMAFPATEMSMKFIGEVTSPMSPFSETILSLISCGVNSTDELVEATGVDSDLLTAGIFDLIESFYIVSDSKLLGFEITKQGMEALEMLSTKSPIENEVIQIFDQVTRKLSSAEFSSNRDLDSRTTSTLPFPTDKSVVASASLAELRGLLLQVEVVQQTSPSVEPRRVEISEILGSRVRRKGQIIGKLIIWQNLSAQRVDFLVEIDQQRSQSHEAVLRKLGGLKALGISPQPISKKEISSIRRNTESPGPTKTDLENISYLSEATKKMPDGGSVRPANHSQLLAQAIKSSSRRLLIISPWLNSHVISWIFLRDLESLLKRRRIEVTIAWGFDDATGKHSVKNNWGVTRKLLLLSKKYSNFNFLKLDQSHMKILVFDNNYICTSHNWLSYTGNQPRMEWGELRTDPSVVSDRYDELMEILPRVGHKVTDSDIPERSSVKRTSFKSGQAPVNFRGNKR
jgi:hypothetical protein